MDKGWQFGIDRGGTFTDVIGRSPDGSLKIEKVLSESAHYEDSGIEGIRRILELEKDSPLPENQIEWIRMGTTVATNALLEKKGAKTALIINQGFKDLIQIGTQDRPDLFALHIPQPQMLYEEVCEVAGRILPDGSILEELDKDQLITVFAQLHESGFQSIAVVQLFSWVNPDHELQIEEIAQKFNFQNISLSHKTLQIAQAVKRGRITLLDAYLSPILSNYTKRIKKQTGNIPLYFMGSSGSLFGADHFTGKEAVLSGPAGGVIALHNLSKETEERQLLGFDMGGTSTDVSRYAGDFEYAMDHKIADTLFSYPMLRVDTVAAGGGSIIHFDGERLCVGPESAGSNPGPACYGLDGPATITDANLVLGRIQSTHFPSVFGTEQNLPLDCDASIKRFEEIRIQMQKAGYSLGIEEIAMGSVRIANESMARPIRDITVGRGIDSRTHTLVTFGGAGAQHACEIAQILGISQILIPKRGSVLSADGILNTLPNKKLTRSFIRDWSQESFESAKSILDFEAKKVLEILLIEQAENAEDTANIDTKYWLSLQVKGTEGKIRVPVSSFKQMTDAFVADYQKTTGFFDHSAKIEITEVHLEISLMKEVKRPTTQESFHDQNTELGTATVFTSEFQPLVVPVFESDSLPVGWSYKDPCLVVSQNSTLFVSENYRVSKKETDILTLERKTEAITSANKESKNQEITKDPILLEIFNNRFMSIAEQMGEVLMRTAHSVNIRERKDFSCALFDKEGHLIANAPHIPVHLGAMGQTVKNWLAEKKDVLEEGQFYCTNDPYAGGSHLPDITVMAPVFRNGKLAYCIAARGHHADIGGIVPGSMPPFAKDLDEEGIVLKHLLIQDKTSFLKNELESQLNSKPYPARNIPERIADILAQVAAVQHGIREIAKLCQEYQDKVVEAYTRFIRENASNEVQKVLSRLIGNEAKKVFNSEECFDDGTKIRLQITLNRRGNKISALFDFAGTDAELANNLNAPVAVSYAAVLYCLRCLVDKSIPLNDGSMETVKIIIPKGCLLNPNKGRAVSGGNVETSQKVVDVIFGAFGCIAGSQGTMNNFLFGSVDGSGRQYYETIAGGMGACEKGLGASAIQVHMTNTSITDPETLELRYPQVRLTEFTIRQESGGHGKFRGGNGVRRRFLFHKDQMVSIISQRRKFPALGILGGANGELGRNYKIDRNNQRISLPNSYQGIVQAGESIEIQTPGGGGYQKPALSFCVLSDSCA